MGDQSPHFHGSQIDPEATLSNVDLVKFLMNDASSKTADLWKDVMKELDLDRNHNKEVNKQIVEGLGKRIDALERYISSSLDHPSSNVPPTPKPPQHTFTCYLCPHSFHSLSSLDEHIVANHPSMLCEECGQTLRSKPDLYLHQHRHHSQTLEHASSVLCSPDRDCPGPTCDSSEQYHTVLSENANEIQQSSDRIPCLVCDKCDSTFHCNSDLDNHINSHHTLPVLYNRFLGPESQIRGSPSPHPMLFHCFECDYRFLTQKHLVEHVRAKHGVSAIHACPNCETIFVSSEFLERHKQTCHEFSNTWPTPAPFFSPVSEIPNINAALIHCKTCEATFNDMRQLNIHSLEHNEVTEVSNSTIEYINNDKQSGDPRAITYSTSTQLTSPPPIGDISDILQVDGIDDSETGLEVAKETSNVARLVGNYSLNQNKQLAGLAKHSKLQDFDISVNDNDKNVNIQCSTGFYEAVAKPAFASLSKGFKVELSSVLVECDEIRATHDLSDSLSGVFLKFKLTGCGIRSVPASVSVHLHNTQQKVQLQGGTKMPDNNTAAVWFTQRVLKQRFSLEAKNKKFSIENINKIVASLSELNHFPSTAPKPPPDFCFHCSKRFSAQSRPMVCIRCSNFKHTTRCAPCPTINTPLSSFQGDNARNLCLQSSPTVDIRPSLGSTHVSFTTTDSPIPSICRGAPPVSSSSSSSLSPETNTQQGESLPSPPAKKSRINHAGKDPDIDKRQSNRTAGAAETTSLTFSTVSRSSPAITTASNSSLHQAALPVNASPTTASLGPTSQEINHGKKRTRNLKSVPKSNEQLEIDYLKIELNRAQTQVIALETENKDLERKVKVMKEVITMHEQRQTSGSYTSLFPGAAPPPITHPTEQSSFQSDHIPRIPSQQSCCHPLPPCQAWPSHCLAQSHCCCTQRSPHRNSRQGDHEMEIKELKAAVDKVQGELVDVIDKLEGLNMVRNAPPATENSVTCPAPAYRNPHDIPQFNNLETVLNVEVNHGEPHNVSVVSCDEFVPDILLHPLPVTGPTNNHVLPLNCQSQTSQQL